MSISLSFYGAARHVTGSKHLLTVNGRRVLLDCGLVQGPRREAERQNRRMPFDAKSLDAVVLSHAHIDHSGSLPRLVKEHYRGPIHCTHATEDLLGVLLPDSAHIQEMDARHLRKRGHHVEPHYDKEDVARTLGQVRGQGYLESFEVCEGVTATFLDAGHILGSAQVVLDVDDGSRKMRILFTGDIGRTGMPILRDPTPIPEVDVVISESTYGNRSHPPLEGLADEVVDLVNEELGRGGRILVPSFAVGRTQNILWYLSRLMQQGLLPAVPVYVDSPLATKATAITAKHQDLYDTETRAMLHAGHDPFAFDSLRLVQSVEESRALNHVREGIIIASSGMCEGGRILHHLKRSIGRSEDLIVMVGYQGHGTLGRKLVEGYERVRIFGERHRVRARVRTINGMSAHADREGLLAHLAPTAKTAEQCFLVHGEERAALSFAEDLEDHGFRSVEVPLHEESFTLH